MSEQARNVKEGGGLEMFTGIASDRRAAACQRSGPSTHIQGVIDKFVA